jgi:hypothetical protein
MDLSTVILFVKYFLMKNIVDQNWPEKDVQYKPLGHILSNLN